MHPRIASRRGVVGLASDAFSSVTRLVETEIALARAEFGEKLEAVKSSLLFLVGGAVFLVAAVFLVLQTIVQALEAAGMQPHWATLLVAAGSAALGAGLFYAGKERFDPVPKRTIKELSRDSAVVQEQLS
jgi:O-antigen/teichoic acid export membrane protein